MEKPNATNFTKQGLAKAKSDDPIRVDFAKLTTDEMLEKLANTACASRIIPESMSLEGYLSDLEAKKTNS